MVQSHGDFAERNYSNIVLCFFYEMLTEYLGKHLYIHRFYNLMFSDLLEKVLDMKSAEDLS
jgi:hypothetical protein